MVLVVLAAAPGLVVTPGLVTPGLMVTPGLVVPLEVMVGRDLSAWVRAVVRWVRNWRAWVGVAGRFNAGGLGAQPRQDDAGPGGLGGQGGGLLV